MKTNPHKNNETKGCCSESLKKYRAICPNTDNVIEVETDRDLSNGIFCNEEECKGCTTRPILTFTEVQSKDHTPSLSEGEEIGLFVSDFEEKFQGKECVCDEGYTDGCYCQITDYLFEHLPTLLSQTRANEKERISQRWQSMSHTERKHIDPTED